jgi:ppGpp synthetase/RelA/SpoT-type nucleotidyltranferase
MKPTFEKYTIWFKDKFDTDLNSKSASIYQYVIQKLTSDFENLAFYKELQNSIRDFNDEYFLKYGYSLLKIEPIKIFSKPYESLLNKSYRKNILYNENYPEEPNGGWITPENWYTKINDLLRTMITVRYLDGVEFIANKIKILAEKYKFIFSVDFEAREEGYYAAHISLEGKFNIVDDNWNMKEIDLSFEIQVTTQLQEVIKTLLHKMYEEVRLLPIMEKNQKWQWDYKSMEFRSNYLGHILHYVEGMILEVRDKQKQNNIKL